MPGSHQNTLNLSCHCSCKDLETRTLSCIFSFPSWHSHFLSSYGFVHGCSLFLPFPTLIPHTHLLLNPCLLFPWLFLFWQFLNLDHLRASRRRAHFLFMYPLKSISRELLVHLVPVGPQASVRYFTQIVQSHCGPVIWVLQTLFHTVESWSSVGFTSINSTQLAHWKALIYHSWKW